MKYIKLLINYYFSFEDCFAVGILCGELFPWTSASKLPAVSLYTESELSWIISYCEKIGIPCIPVFNQGQVRSILASRKGYEKVCTSDVNDLKAYSAKLIPDFLDDIFSLFTQEQRLLLLSEDKNTGFNDLFQHDDLEIIVLTQQVFDFNNNGDFLIFRNEKYLYSLTFWQPLNPGSPGNDLFYPVAESGRLQELGTFADSYQILAAELAALYSATEQADSHSRTGFSSYPLQFWQGNLDVYNQKYKIIEQLLISFLTECNSYIHQCWLKSRIESQKSFHSLKKNQIFSMCRQHLFFYLHE